MTWTFFLLIMELKHSHSIPFTFLSNTLIQLQLISYMHLKVDSPQNLDDHWVGSWSHWTFILTCGHHSQFTDYHHVVYYLGFSNGVNNENPNILTFKETSSFVISSLISTIYYIRKLMCEGSFIVSWVNQHPRWYHAKKSQNSLKMFFYPWSLAIYSLWKTHATDFRGPRRCKP
jgi:hypothetical protein